MLSAVAVFSFVSIFVGRGPVFTRQRLGDVGQGLKGEAEGGGLRGKGTQKW